MQLTRAENVGPGQTDNLFHCLGQLDVSPDKVIYNRSSVNSLSGSYFFNKGRDLVIKIYGNVQFHILTKKFASLAFRKIIFGFHLNYAIDN